MTGDLKILLKDLIVVWLAISILASIPVISTITMVFIPLPIMYCLARYGRSLGLILSGLSLVLVFFAMEAIGAAPIFPVVAVIAILGVIISEVLRLNLTIELTTVAATFAFLLVGFGFILYLGRDEDLTFLQLLNHYLTSYITATIDTYAQLHLAGEHISMLRDHTREIVYIVMVIFPALVLVSSAFSVLVNIIGATLIFPWLKLSVPDFGDLTKWRPAEKIIWILIAAGGMMLLPWGGGKIIGLNILIVLIFVYLLAGLAVADFLLMKINIPRMFRYIFYFFIFLQQYLLIFVVALGLIDVWVDFRKVAPKEVS